MAYGIRAIPSTNVVHEIGQASAKSSGDLLQVWNGPTSADEKLALDYQGNLSITGYIEIADGVSAPGAGTGARIYVDQADGDLKVVFGDGTLKTLSVDT